MGTNYFGNNNQGLQVGQSTAPIHASIHIAPAHPESPPRSTSTIIPRADAAFVNREDLLSLVRTQAAVKGARLALVGLGGVGKTQTAIHYAKSRQDAGTWVLWLHAANEARFNESIRDVADQIRLPGRQYPNADILQLLLAWLADSKRQWLVVLDNVDDAGFLLLSCSTAGAAQTSKRRIDYIPDCDHSTVIITSRSKEEARRLVEEDSVIEVTAMDAVHAKALLQKKLGSLYTDESATKLAAALDFMPLALSQAASFIKQKSRYTIEKYLAEIESSRQSRTSLLRQHGTVPKREREASSSIIDTWQISFEHIWTTCPTAAILLGVMSLCDRQAIPELLLRGVPQGKALSVYQRVMRVYEQDGMRVYDLAGLNFSFDDDIQMLEAFSFVSSIVDTRTWTMHRLVQDAMQQWLLDRGEFPMVQEMLIDNLYTVTPLGEFENWNTCRILMPHIEAAIELQKSQEALPLRFATVLHMVAWYELRRGSFAAAMELAESSLSIRRRLLQADHEGVLSMEYVLSRIYTELGRWHDAETLALKVLQVRMRVLGQEHRDTLTAMEGLAAAYSEQGRHEEALKLTEKVLETSMRVLGGDHPDTLINMANLALSYHNQERYQEASKLGVKVLEASKRANGEEHPSTLTTMSNLAQTYSALGCHKAAVELAEKALEITTRVFGEEHPDTLSTMYSLAIRYCEQQRSAEALSLAQRCFELRQKALGESHPCTERAAKLAKALQRLIGKASQEQLDTKMADTTLDNAAHHSTQLRRLREEDV